MFEMSNVIISKIALKEYIQPLPWDSGQQGIK